MEMQVPAGTQPGDQLVLTKMGVPRLNKPTLRGDHIFTVAVAIPNKLRSGPGATPHAKPQTPNLENPETLKP